MKSCDSDPQTNVEPTGVWLFDLNIHTISSYFSKLENPFHFHPPWGIVLGGGLWERQENLFMLGGFSFLWWISPWIKINQRRSCLVFYWVWSFPLHPGFSGGLWLWLQSPGAASASERDVKLHLNAWLSIQVIFYNPTNYFLSWFSTSLCSGVCSAICPILRVGFMETTDLLHRSSPTICSPTWPFWSGAKYSLTQHMSPHDFRRASSLAALYFIRRATACEQELRICFCVSGTGRTAASFTPQIYIINNFFLCLLFLRSSIWS